MFTSGFSGSPIMVYVLPALSICYDAHIVAIHTQSDDGLVSSNTCTEEDICTFW